MRPPTRFTATAIADTASAAITTNSIHVCNTRNSNSARRAQNGAPRREAPANQQSAQDQQLRDMQQGERLALRAEHPGQPPPGGYAEQEENEVVQLVSHQRASNVMATSVPIAACCRACCS